MSLDFHVGKYTAPLSSLWEGGAESRSSNRHLCCADLQFERGTQLCRLPRILWFDLSYSLLWVGIAILSTGEERRFKEGQELPTVVSYWYKTTSGWSASRACALSLWNPGISRAELWAPLTHICIPSSSHGAHHIVGPQKCWLSRKCGCKHQEYCESLGSQGMLGSEGGLSKECLSLISQWRKLRPGEGKRHFQGHGIHLCSGRVYCLAFIPHLWPIGTCHWSPWAACGAGGDSPSSAVLCPALRPLLFSQVFQNSQPRGEEAVGGRSGSLMRGGIWRQGTVQGPAAMRPLGMPAGRGCLWCPYDSLSSEGMVSQALPAD